MSLNGIRVKEQAGFGDTGPAENVCTERLHHLSDVLLIDELALYFCSKYCDIVTKNISVFVLKEALTDRKIYKTVTADAIGKLIGSRQIVNHLI